MIERQGEVAQFRAPGFPLSEEGKEQIKKLAASLGDRGVAAIYSSPILRCKETADLLAKGIKSEPRVLVQIDERLVEVDSPFEGMETGKYQAKLGGMSLYEVPEQREKGESAEGIVARMRAFLDEVLEKHADQVVVAVSHGDPIMLLWCSLLGRNVYSLRADWPEYIPRAGYYEFKFDRGELAGQKLVIV